MVVKLAQVLVKYHLPVLEVHVVEMECGEVGLHGHFVEVTVKDQDQDLATIPLRQMVVKLAQVLVKYRLPVLEVHVEEMECGEIGLHGLHVEMTVKDQEQEVVTILHPLMVENHALGQIRNSLHVQATNAKWMECGGIGLLGQFVGITA